MPADSDAMFQIVGAGFYTDIQCRFAASGVGSRVVVGPMVTPNTAVCGAVSWTAESSVTELTVRTLVLNDIPYVGVVPARIRFLPVVVGGQSTSSYGYGSVVVTVDAEGVTLADQHMCVCCAMQCLAVSIPFSLRAIRFVRTRVHGLRARYSCRFRDSSGQVVVTDVVSVAGDENVQCNSPEWDGAVSVFDVTVLYDDFPLQVAGSANTHNLEGRFSSAMFALFCFALTCLSGTSLLVVHG